MKMKAECQNIIIVTTHKIFFVPFPYCFLGMAQVLCPFPIVDYKRHCIMMPYHLHMSPITCSPPLIKVHFRGID
ncbi:unnamed protein product [Linum tenue]|uniref:Uncharacterized protein n=1 Tax=Linum tenue TaxID=586396 RepID=A0AAV0M749_9ROSI|nr:unnamed protein product [Linum tenue]